MKRVLLLMAMVAVLALSSVPASAQGDPGLLPENHYLVWRLVNPNTFAGPVTLDDQFGSVIGDQFVNDKWGNPLFMKNDEPVIWDETVHQNWWRLEPPVPQHLRKVKVQHQLGVFDLETFDAAYLLNPADKLDQIPGWPTWANHYLCYDAAGPPLGLTLTVTDQWGTWTVVVMDPAFFCNPVQKTDPDGNVYDIIDPNSHLTCYWVDPVSAAFTFNYDDQWGFWDNIAEQTCLVCLPSLKLQVLPTEESTWGRIKSLYSE